MTPADTPVEHAYIATAACGCTYAIATAERHDRQGVESLAAGINEWLLQGGTVDRLPIEAARSRFSDGMSCTHDPKYSGLRNDDELLVPERTDAALIARDITYDLMNDTGRSSLVSFLDRAFPGQASEQWWEDAHERLEEALICFITQVPRPAEGAVTSDQLQLEGAA